MEYFFQIIDLICFMSLSCVFAVFLIIPLVNQVCFLLDSLFEDIGFSIISKVGRKFRIEERPSYQKLLQRLSPKDCYYRYETPLFALGLSYVGINVVYGVFLSSKDETFCTIVLTILYLFFYLLGMYRKYKHNSALYDKVLAVNSAYLTLFFIPFSFFVTIISFILSITDVYEFKYERISLSRFFTTSAGMLDHVSGIVTIDFLLLAYKLVVLFVLYSLPSHLIVYFLLKTIGYFRKYGKPYSLYFKKVLSFVKHN